MNVFEEFLNFLMPAKCSLCGKSGSPFCAACQSASLLQTRLISRFDLHGFGVCEYTANIAKLIHDFKENSQTELARSMAIPLAKSVPSDCEVFVPMPSKKSAAQNRGFNPAKILAAALAREIAKTENRLVKVCDVLRLSRAVSDQAALSGQDRRTNLTGAMTTKRNAAKVFSRLPSVWLVDDIVTTGATLQEAARCLKLAGVEVSGFLVFAETLPKNRQKAPAKSL